MKPHQRKLVDLARAMGAEAVRIETGRRHPRLVFVVNGTTLRQPIGRSDPSDYRATCNAAAQLRRRIRDLRGR